MLMDENCVNTRGKIRADTRDHFTNCSEASLLVRLHPV